MQNWAGTIEYAAATIHRPTSVDELCATVAATERIRALGTRHSFNDLADTTADLVSLAEMPMSIDIEPDAASVTVAAGVRYGELGVALHEAGWALANMASLPHISVAGAVATATHGSGVANGNLSTAVSAIEMVTADGELRWIRRGDTDFDGCVVALGALGVVHRITLDIEPTYDVTQYVYDDMPFAELGDAVFGGGYSVSVFTDWAAPRANTVWVKDRVAPGDRGGWSPPRQWHGSRMA
ncbi:MAG TPA: FAD-binding protein, partial [Micromonosporaceae bacterium]